MIEMKATVFYKKEKWMHSEGYWIRGRIYLLYLVWSCMCRCMNIKHLSSFKIIGLEDWKIVFTMYLFGNSFLHLHYLSYFVTFRPVYNIFAGSPFPTLLFFVLAIWLRFKIIMKLTWLLLMMLKGISCVHHYYVLCNFFQQAYGILLRFLPRASWMMQNRISDAF